jgi:hypothetical protein
VGERDRTVSFIRPFPDQFHQSLLKAKSKAQREGKIMRYNKASIVYVLMLLGVSLLCACGANLQRFSRSESSNGNGGSGINSFNYRRFPPSHGFRLHGNHLPEEEEKRLTPNGANPLHN